MITDRLKRPSLVNRLVNREIIDWKDKLEKTRAEIAEQDKILVAFSGGVGSSLLAKISRDILGENALHVILDSETLSRSELKYAEELARSSGLKYEVMKC